MLEKSLLVKEITQLVFGWIILASKKITKRLQHSQTNIKLLIMILEQFKKLIPLKNLDIAGDTTMFFILKKQNIKLSSSLFSKLKSTIKNEIRLVLRLSSKSIVNSDDKIFHMSY